MNALYQLDKIQDPPEEIHYFKQEFESLFLNTVTESNGYSRIHVNSSNSPKNVIIQPTWTFDTLETSRLLEIPQNANSEIKIKVQSSQNDFTDAFTGQIYALKLLLTGKFDKSTAVNLKKFGDAIKSTFDMELVDTLDELWLKIFEVGSLKELSAELQRFIKKACVKVPVEWSIKKSSDDYRAF